LHVTDGMPAEAVFAVVGILLLGYSAWSFPSSLATGGAFRVVVSGAALLTYGAAFLGVRQSRSAPVQRAIGVGRQAGIALASAAVVSHAIEVFAAPRPPVPAILGVAMWGLMFLVLGAAAAETCRRERSIVLGILSSTWGVLLSASITVVFALSVGLLFMSRMERLLGVAPAGVVRNMLDGAMSHLLLAPAVAVAAAVASGVAYSVVKSVRSRTAVALAVVAGLVCVGGLSALRLASTLERPARPPYVMLGVVSLGMGLTSAAALFAAIRKQF
jgi:hypothetical protein